MADSSLLMPAADDAYRRSRDRLRAAEIDLRDRIEAVAAMRRELPRVRSSPITPSSKMAVASTCRSCLPPISLT